MGRRMSWSIRNVVYAALALLLAPTLLLAGEENLIQNPGFEEAGENPAGWQRVFVPAHSAGLTFGIDDRSPFAGKKSVFISNEKEGNPIFNSWSQSFRGKALDAVPRDTPILLTAAVRTEKATFANVWVQCFDGADVQLKLYSVNPLRPIVGTSGWNKYAAKVVVPIKTTTIIVRAVLQGRGKVWFDDICLMKGLSEDGIDQAVGSVVPTVPDQTQVAVVACEGAYVVVPEKRWREDGWIEFSVPFPFTGQSPFALSVRTVPEGRVGKLRLLESGDDAVLRVELKPRKDDETIRVLWESVVLAATRKSFFETTAKTAIVKPGDVPDDIRVWLRPAKGLESDNEEIKKLASELGKGCRTLYDLATGICGFMTAKMRFAGGASQGALDSLKSGQAVCTGYANLVCALYQAAGVPARVLSCLPNGGDLQEHFIVEVYCREHGWILHESTMSLFPYADSNIAVIRVVDPDDPRSPADVPLLLRSAQGVFANMECAAFGAACYHRSRILQTGWLRWQDLEIIQKGVSTDWSKAIKGEDSSGAELRFIGGLEGAGGEGLSPDAKDFLVSIAGKVREADEAHARFVADFAKSLVVPVLAEGKNVLVNEGFEEADDAGRPKGWSEVFVQGQADKVAFRLDGAVKRSGKSSAKIENRGAFGYSSWTQQVTGSASGKRIRLRGFVKTDGLKDGKASLVAICVNPNVLENYGQLYFGTTETAQPVSGSSDWAEVALEFTAPVKTTAILVRCGLWGTGTAWFDDVSLEAVAEHDGK